jgi:hypothetical protein
MTCQAGHDLDRHQHPNVRHLSRMLISLLAATAFAGNTAEIATSRPVPPANQTASPVSWSQVENASGHLAFVQTLTSYALTAPVEEFPSALAAVERWSQLAPSTKPLDEAIPGEPDERKIRARRTLAYSFTTRAPDQAIAYHVHASAEVLAHFRPVFFAELTRLDLNRARTELLKIPVGDERQKAASAIVIALSKTDPFTALALRRELDVTDGSAVATVFEATAQLDPQKALTALASLPDGPLRKDARERVLSEWMLKSSNDALVWISSNIPEADRPAFLDIVLGRTGVRYFALLASIEEQTRAPLIKAAATRAISSRLRYQPVQYAWDRVLTRGWEGISQELQVGKVSFFRTLDDLVRFSSTQPPEQVRKFFRSLPAGYGEDAANAAAIMKTWTLVDPESALAWADKLPAGKARDAAAHQGQIMLVELDPELAFARLGTLPPGEMRTRLAQATFFELAKKDLKSAITRSPLPESVLSELYGMAAVVRVASDYAPDTMIALVRETSPPTIFTAEFASNWLFNEPEDALAWYFAQPDGDLKAYLKEPAARALAGSDPTRAIELAISMPDGSERVALIDALIDYHSVEQPTSVLALIESLPASGQRSDLHTKAILKLAEADPARTAAQLDSGALGPINRQAINSIVSKWSDESAADCARWLTPHLKPSQNHPDLILNAVDQVARNYAQQDPAAAITWAGTLTDPAASQKATAAAIETIGKSSRDFALRLLAESTLPETQKNELAARIRR